jgi:hypothetical protein
LQAGGPNDGGSGADVAEGGSIDAATFCLTDAAKSSDGAPPFFCADFGDGTITRCYQKGESFGLKGKELDVGADAGWSHEGMTDPGSLEFTMAAITDNSALNAHLNTPAEFNETSSHVVLEAAVWLSARPTETDSTIDLMTVVLNNPDTVGQPARAFYQITSAGTDLISVEGTTIDTKTVPPLPTQQWTRVRYELTLGTSISAKLFYDGKVQDTATAPTSRFHPAAGASFLMGLAAQGPAPPYTLRLDDILFLPE